MSYLIDTNLISEVRKGAKCDANVTAWYDSVDDADIYLSVLVLSEIRKGVERARRSNPTQARALEKWLATRNVSDVADLGADFVNPFEHRA